MELLRPAIHIGDLTNRLINKVMYHYTGDKVPFDGNTKANVVMMGSAAGYASPLAGCYTPLRRLPLIGTLKRI